MSAAIYYHPEAYSTSGPRLMGRNAAGESFIRGYFAHSCAKEFWAYVHDVNHAQEFAGVAKKFGRIQPVKAVGSNSIGQLRHAGALYYPGPDIARQAYSRAVHGHDAWSLCGITHTTSSARAMDALSELITAPVHPWDAVICTSRAVKNNVERVLQANVEYLTERLGINRLVLPQLPVIPLGIHTEDFTYTSTQKAEARAALGVSPETLVVLFMGRLSFHAKAHPLAMYQALEQAALTTGKSVVLVECGWHPNDFIAKAYAEAAQVVCPSVRVHTLDGRNADERRIAWAGADVFCSLSDNIQETFGIVPIEAMAAGLPVVVSDWDGYKDTVRDDVDGFRIPTYMPQAGLAGDLAQRHALEIDSYDMYCGHTSSLIAVDVQAATSAFVKLFESPELRNQMGKSGEQRAREIYDWSAIIPQYESLWAELAEIRRTQSDTHKTSAHPWPARLDPFYAFGDYPTHVLAQETLLGLVVENPNLAMLRVQKYSSLTMVNYAKFVLPSEDEIKSVVAAASNGPRPAIHLVEGIAADRKAYVFRALTWLMKIGVLRAFT